MVGTMPGGWPRSPGPDGAGPVRGACWGRLGPGLDGPQRGWKTLRASGFSALAKKVAFIFG